MFTILTGNISSKKGLIAIITEISVNRWDKRLIKGNQTGKHKRRERIKTEWKQCEARKTRHKGEAQGLLLASPLCAEKERG